METATVKSLPLILHLWVMAYTKILLSALSVAALVVLGPIELALPSMIPITLQSLVVLLIAICLGSFYGGLAIASYLLLGGLGAPIFSGGASGWAHFTGPSAGFLLGFLFSALLVGWIAENFDRTWQRVFGLFLLGHVIILTFGFFYLVNFQPGAEILTEVFVPLLPGLFIKSFLGTVVVYLLGKVLWQKQPSLT